MFRTLVVGWIAGGTMIVLLALPAMTREAAPSASGAADVTGAAPFRTGAWAGKPALGDGSDILLPVAGVHVRDLRDSFTQARSGGRTHNAIDILAPRGTPVLAAVDGSIRKLLTSSGGGLTIYQFDAHEERVYYYAHLDRYADAAKEGAFVKQGTVIGYVGTTGNARQTPHLHFAIDVLPASREWWKGVPLNPYPILQSAREIAGA